MYSCRQHSMSSTSKLSSSMGQQSSKSLFSSPASLISGKSLSEKLDRLEKQLKKKEQLRNKIDSSMYNFQHKSSRLNPKNARQSQCASRNSAAARSSIVASRRNSVIGRNSNGGGGTTTSSRSDLSQHPEEGAAGSVPLPPSSSPSPLYSPKPPPGKRPVATSSPPLSANTATYPSAKPNRVCKRPTQQNTTVLRSPSRSLLAVMKPHRRMCHQK